MSSQPTNAAAASSHTGHRSTDYENDVKLRACSKQRLTSYSPPAWAGDLRGIPTVKIELSNKNTPIQRWFLPGVPDGFEVYIKRDDRTGCSLSGNKARKLEFLLAEALAKDHDSLITCGGMNSNCCRSITAAGRELGLKSHLLLRSGSGSMDDVRVEGNLAMNQLLGASIYLLPVKAKYKRDALPRMEMLATHLRSHSKMSPYLVPVGGTCPVGLFGHIECFDELKQQGALDDFSDLIITTGSGGSAAGFCIGNYLNGEKLKLHGMAVCDNAPFFHGEINDLLRSVGLQDKDKVTSEGLITFDEGVKGRGHGLSTEEELGSVLGALDGRLKDLLKSGRSYHSVYDWNNLDQSPLSSLVDSG